MLYFETRYDALKGEMTRLETETLAFRDGTRTAPQIWPYWAPVVILSLFTGDFA